MIGSDMSLGSEDFGKACLAMAKNVIRMWSKVSKGDKIY